MKKFILPIIVLLVVGGVLLLRRQAGVPFRQSSDLIFGTVYHVTYQSADDLADGIRACLEQVDASLSPFNPQSVITAVNENRDTLPDTLFTDVFRRAMDISRQTGGAFDITVAPLVNAWGFGFKSGTAPSRRQVDSLLAIVGYQKVQLTGGRVVKQDARTMLDCSAIAKGYGADVVARYLLRCGVTNFLVEIGGEVVASGQNSHGQPWRVGVAQPTEDSLSTGQGPLQTVLSVSGRALATSGNYRNFYYRGGRRYAHTIDPATGYPVEHSLLSATVLADDCATADAYATAFMVMGLDSARVLLARHPELSAYLIYSDSTGCFAVWQTEN